MHNTTTTTTAPTYAYSAFTMGRAVMAVWKGATYGGVENDLLVLNQAHEHDLAIITFAGIWAEKRACWAWDGGYNEDDLSFDDYVIDETEADSVEMALFDAAWGMEPERRYTFQTEWTNLMRSLWPAIQHLAFQMSEGVIVTHDDIKEAIDTKCSRIMEIDLSDI